MQRFKAYLLIGLSYLAALGLAYIVWSFLPEMHIVWSLLIADVVATVVIWLFGLLFENSSFYDPYWSVIPWAILLFVMIYFKLFSATNIIIFSALSLWSWRLTVNWAYTCKDINTQDWRYTKFKQENKLIMWHIINFFGINMMPTLFVYLGLIPPILLIMENAAFNPLTLIGTAVILFGTLLEFFADNQMHAFRKRASRGEVMQSGLWKYSRHPNYLGEISIWMGVYLCMVVQLPMYWYACVGAILMVVLFAFISIPMMEKRQVSRRAAYADYRNKTSMLLLLPNRRNKDR